MLRNYVLIALRRMRRRAGYTGLNLAGLTAGLAVGLLILLFVHDELRFDRHHARADRIYRLVQARAEERHTKPFEEMSPLLTGVLAEGMPEVETAVRFLSRSHTLVASEDGRVRAYEDAFLYADSTFFDVFSFPLLLGDAATALDRPFRVVLSARAAERYFGDDDPLGRTLLYDNTHPFEVAGVAADPPSSSSIRFDFLVSFSTLRHLPLESPMLESGWGVAAYPTYVLLREDVDPATVEAKLPALLARHTDAPHVLEARFGLEPIADVHLYSKAPNTLGPQSDRRYVYLFSAIGALILLIACINYMNMATAQAAGRGREVGVRKVVGAGRGQLARQFLGESLLTCLAAMVLALGLVQATLPLFADLAGRDLPADVLGTPRFWLVLAALVGTVGLVAGSYPALLLSRFAPVDVLKGRLQKGRSGAALRKALVVFQFTVSAVLIASTLLIQHQLDYVRTKRLGLEAEQVLVMPLQSVVAQPNPIRRQIDAFKAELEKQPGVAGVAASSAVPTRRASRFGLTRTDSEAQVYFYAYRIDPSYLSTLGIELLEGAALTETAPPSSVLINEAAARAFGWAPGEPYVGRPLPVVFGGETPMVAGVVRDFHFESLHQAIEPVVFSSLAEGRAGYVVARVQAADLRRSVGDVADVWRQFAPDHPFEYFFLDDAFDGLYQAEERLARLFGAFALTGILIACLGLFGLAAFTAEQRTKEIGIRKVLGATILNLVALLTGGFLRLVALAFVIAVPVTYLAMQSWLDGFAYRVDISWPIFLLTGLAALGVAILAVGYQAVRAALSDPVKALRYE